MTNQTIIVTSVIFNNPGIYEIHLSLGNGICPSVMFNVPDFIVQGTPSVNLNNANNFNSSNIPNNPNFSQGGSRLE